MRPIRKILYPTDFSALSRRALPYAAQLATRFDAELDILHVELLHELGGFEEEQFPRYRELLDALQQETGQLMASLETGVAKDRLRGQKVVRRAVAAAPEILDYAEEADIDLIVLSTHGRRGFRRLMLGSVAAEVVRHARRPVLTVHATERALSWKGFILVPVDFSEVTDDAVEAAAQLSGLTGAPIELYHAVMPVQVPVVFDALPEAYQVDTEKVAKEARERLHELRRRFKLEDQKCMVRVDQGDAAHDILARIEEGDVALTVIGAHGRTGLTRFLLGSVAERVVTQATCPVLTVKREEDATVPRQLVAGDAVEPAPA